MTDSRCPTLLERIVKWTVIVLTSYWALYSLVVPVTVWDSQSYNVGRLMIAHHGGLFHNHGWNDDRQICLPWSFDAVHYPFLFLGFGYALPSFVCFVGLMTIVHRLVKEKYGTGAAWWCCLALLALPTLMYQATSTKNDIVMVFSVFCWFYALRYWEAQKKQVYLALMALALSFTAGAKTSGLPWMALLTVVTLWRIGWNRRALLNYTLFFIVSFFFFGSVEVYINNWRTYKHVLGPVFMAEEYKNHEGMNGAVANGIRYYFGFMNLGVNVAQPGAFCTWLQDTCRAFLGFIGLKDVGYIQNYNDGKFYITKVGVEAASDFGPLGAVSAVYALGVLLFFPTKDVLWKIVGAGFVFFGILCYELGWQPWNNRFLMIPIVLFALAFILGMVRNEQSKFYQCIKKPLYGFLLFGAVAFPLYSYNKGPADLMLSITNRDKMTSKERVEMLEIMKELQSLPEEGKPVLVLLHAGPNAWVLPFLQIPLKTRGIDVLAAPKLGAGAWDVARKIAAGRRIYVLALEHAINPDPAAGLEVVKKFECPNCTLLSLKQPSGG